jgi:hypothetical protein
MFQLYSKSFKIDKIFYKKLKNYFQFILLFSNIYFIIANKLNTKFII